VLDEGRLEQQVLSSGRLYAQDELSATATQLNKKYEGKASKELASDESDLSELESLVMESVVSVMRSVDEGGAEEAYLEGLRHILSQPEFSDSAAVLGLLELLDGQNLSRAIPLRALAREGVTVIIGADSPQLTNASEAMRACSVIVGSYGAPGDALGALAVVGPMRMRYSRTISTVRYLADVMSELLSEQYEGPTG
jgi:heat-inducible transcriptional repressor